MFVEDSEQGSLIHLRSSDDKLDEKYFPNKTLDASSSGEIAKCNNFFLAEALVVSA